LGFGGVDGRSQTGLLLGGFIGHWNASIFGVRATICIQEMIEFLAEQFLSRVAIWWVLGVPGCISADLVALRGFWVCCCGMIYVSKCQFMVASIGVSFLCTCGNFAEVHLGIGADVVSVPGPDL